jgi:hypothetical protein
MDHMETKEHFMFSGGMLGRDEKADAELCEAAAKLGILNNCEDARLEAWAQELETRGARLERLTWRQSDDGVLNVQTPRRADMMSRSFSRLQEELRTDSVVWTENDRLHVGIDAVGGNCNMAYTGELSSE